MCQHFVFKDKWKADHKEFYWLEGRLWDCPIVWLGCRLVVLVWLVLLPQETQLKLPLDARLELPLEVRFELPLEVPQELPMELPFDLLLEVPLELPLQLPLDYEKQDLHPTAWLQVVDFVVEGEGAVGHLGEDHSWRVG